MRRRNSGFTLIEMVVAMALLGTMMLLLYSGLTFGLRGWDAADVNGRRTADRRIAENFLRREIGETFPMRFKDPMTLKVAFEGKENVLRFVSSRPAGTTAGTANMPRSKSFIWTAEKQRLVLFRSLTQRVGCKYGNNRGFSPCRRG